MFVPHMKHVLKACYGDRFTSLYVDNVRTPQETHVSKAFTIINSTVNNRIPFIVPSHATYEPQLLVLCFRHACYTSSQNQTPYDCCQLFLDACRFECASLHQLILWLHIAASSDRWLVTGDVTRHLSRLRGAPNPQMGTIIADSRVTRATASALDVQIGNGQSTLCGGIHLKKVADGTAYPLPRFEMSVASHASSCRRMAPQLSTGWEEWRLLGCYAVWLL
jgi:hypothetical protein